MDPKCRSILKPRTILAQAFGAGDETTRALTPPVHVSTTFIRDADNGYQSGYVYGRTDNATVKQVELILATLEGAQDAMLFSSGMAAATAVFLALDKPTHIIASHVIYWGFREWLQDVGRYGGHSVTFVDTTDLEAVAEAVRPGETGIFWIETPSNPLWTITDIAAIAEIAHGAGALLCVDSTVSTPIITRPIAFGADLVVHSATKYLNGHSDVIAGAVAVAEDSPLWQGIQKVRGQLGYRITMKGVVAAEGEAYSGMLMAINPGHVAAALPGTATKDPTFGLPAIWIEAAHRDHAIAVRQMDGLFGGMFSIRLRGGEAAAISVASKVEVWQRATSFGGVESLIEHRASIEGAGTPCPPDLLRLSTGLEDPEDLFADLIRALDQLPRTAEVRREALAEVEVQSS